jgi:hypothetical protein
VADPDRPQQVDPDTTEEEHVVKTIRKMSGAVAVVLTVGASAIITNCGEGSTGGASEATTAPPRDGHGDGYGHGHGKAGAGGGAEAGSAGTGTAGTGGAIATGGTGGSVATGGHAGGGTPPPASCAAVADKPPAKLFWGVWVSPTAEIWVAGEDGWIGHSTRNRSGGGRWMFCQRVPGVTLRAIWGAADTDVWTVGDGGTVLRWDGLDWSAITGVGTPAPGNVYDVWGSSATSVWIVGNDGLVRRFDGTAWHVEDADARYRLRSVWGTPSGVLRVVGAATLPPVFGINGEEAVILRQGSGGSWTREGVFAEERGAAELLRISGASETDIWAVGEKFPSGAAASFAFAAHFDGTAWTARAGTAVAGGPTEAQLGGRVYTDVVAAPPFAPAGALIASPPDSTLFDGTTWTTSPPELTALDLRGSALWGTGGPGEILRWNGTAWVIDIAP